MEKQLLFVIDFKISKKSTVKFSLFGIFIFSAFLLFFFYPKQEAKAQTEQPLEIIDYDANLKIVKYGSITMVAPNEIVCRWSDPNSLWKDCEVVIEVNNSDTKSDLIMKGDTLLAKFLKDVQNFTVYTTYDYTLYNDTILNRTCFDSLNITPEEKDEILRNKSICFYNYTRKNFYNFQPTTKLDKIYKNSVIGIKLVFKSPIVADAGVYLKNHFNFTLLSDYNITLDPDISACSVLDTDYGVYTLTADIIDSGATACMNITANHVILDCQGHTIDGKGTSATYGIYVSRSSATTTNETIKNCVLTNWYYGIFLRYSNSNNISNITANSNSYDGIFLRYSNSSTLSNITANSNTYYGIYLDSSDSNTLSNITANSNSYYGIYHMYSDYTTIKDSNLINNTYADVLYQTSRTAMDCHSNFTNVIGTDNKPIVFYNTSTTIKNWNNNASEIILCGADNSVIDNVTMSHTNVKNNGLFLVATNLTNVSNSVFNNSYYGIKIDSSNSNTLSNITANSNTYYGIYLFESSNNNNLTDITANSNSYYGIYLYSSSSNTIKNSIIQNNSQYGIYLWSSGANLIYNNLFNNTNNFYFKGTIYANSWNTTKQTGTRIYSNGTEIGGNYWTNSTGNGYSDTCTDADKDGFCDSPYILDPGQTGNNTDYLPLSDEYSAGDTAPPQYSLNSTNSTLAGTPVSHNLFWQDNAGLSYAIFSFDNCTGSFQNITGMSLSGTSAWSNFTVIINSTVGCTVRWCVYANDTSNNWNGSSCVTPFSYITVDTAPPTYSLNSTNSTLAGTAVSHNLFWQDNAGLSHYLFSFDNCTGTLVNDTIWIYFNYKFNQTKSANITGYNTTSPDYLNALDSQSYNITEINTTPTDPSIYNWTSPDQETNTKQFRTSASATAYTKYYNTTLSASIVKAYGRSADTQYVTTAGGNSNFGNATAPTFTEVFSTYAPYNFTQLGYTRVSVSDNAYANITSSGSNYEPFGLFNFTVQEDKANINWVYIAMEQSEATSGSTGSGEYCYYAVANWTSGTWYQYGSYVNGQTDTTRTYNATTASAINDLLNNGNVLSMLGWGASMDANEGCRIDFVEVRVNYNISTPNTEQNSSWQTYSGIDGDDYQNVDKIKIILTIDSYNPSASNSTYDNNNRPDIEIGIWNGTAYVNGSYCQLSNYMGSNLPNTTDWNCTIEKTDSQFLNSWKYQANRSVIIRGIWLDAYNGNIYDEINVTGVYGYVDGWNATETTYVMEVEHNTTLDYPGELVNLTVNMTFLSNVTSVFNLTIYNFATGTWDYSKCSNGIVTANAWNNWTCNITENVLNYNSSSNEVKIRLNTSGQSSPGEVSIDYINYETISYEQTLNYVKFGSLEGWSNVTKTINSTVGCTIRWCVYANDTSNNWNGTSCQNPFSYVTTSANQPPSVETPKTYDENYVEKTSFANSSKVVIRVNVTDPQGAGDISKVLITILNSTNNVKVNNVTMTNISSITNGYTYEYNYTLPVDADRGTWTIKVYANDTQNAWGSNSTTFSVYLTLSKIVTQPATVFSILQKTGFVGRVQTIISSIQAVVARTNVIIRLLIQSITFIISTIRKVVSTKALTQPVSLIISISKILSLLKTLPQAISSLPIITKLLATIKTLSQTLSISSITAKLLNFFKVIPQPLNILPVLEKTAAIIRSPTQPLNISPLLTEIEHMVKTLSQPLNIQAILTRGLAPFKSLIQPLNIQALPTRIGYLGRGVSQFATIAISYIRNTINYRSLQAAITIVDVVWRSSITKLATLFQGVQLQTTIEKIIYIFRTQSQFINIQTFVERISTISKGLYQTVVSTISLNRALLREFPQALTLTLSIMRKIASYRISPIILTITSLISRSVNLIRESVATFGITLTLSKAVSKPVEAVIAITDIISRNINSIRILTILPSIQTVLTRVSYAFIVELPQAVNLAITLAKSTFIQKVSTVLLSISLEASKLISSIRELPQAISIVPTVLRGVVVSRVVSLIANITDVLSRTVYSIRSFVEIINIQILMSKSIPIIRSLTETINVVTTVLRERIIGKISMLVITMTSVLTRTAYNIRVLPETIAMTVFVKRAFLTAIELFQALNVQLLLKAINIRILTISITISDIVSRSIVAFKTILMPSVVSIVLEVVSPARYWLILVSPPYSLFEWATRVENLILLILVVGGILSISSYFIWQKRKELFKRPEEKW